MDIGHAAPHAEQADLAVVPGFGAPARFGVAHLQMRGCTVERGAAIARRIERAGQRHRLDQVGVVFAGDESQQVADAQAMRDQRFKLAAAAHRAAALRFEHARIEALRDQVAIEGRLVLEIDFALPARDLVQRRLRDEEVPGLDDLGHLPVEEGEQQGADMRAVDIGVGHDHDLVIAQLLEIEFVAQPGAHRLDQRAHFLRGNDPVEARTLDIEDLALERQDRLRLAVAALLGAAPCRVALDQEEFAVRGVAVLAVGQLARQRGDAHRALAAHFTRAARGFAGGGGVDDLLDDRFGFGGVFLQPFAHLLAHQAFQRRTHFGADQLVLGLRGELGVGQLDRNDRGQAFAHVFA